MVLGVLIGLVAGLAIGVAWHLARRPDRRCGPAGRGPTADAQGRSRELAAQLQTASEAAAAAETARAVALSELELLAHVGGRGFAPGRGGAQLPRRSVRRALGGGAGKEQRAVPRPGRLQAQRGAHGAQGDLSQRQQAIAQLLDPLSETLAATSGGSRTWSSSARGLRGLNERVAALHIGHEQLQKETRNLVTALRSPQTARPLGRNDAAHVVEVAGMVEHCDFDEQVTTTTEEGRLRPDMVVHMPGGGQVVIDAKVPLEAFLQLIEPRTTTSAGSSRSTPGNCAPTWTSWPRKSTGGSSTFARDRRGLHPR